MRRKPLNETLILSKINESKHPSSFLTGLVIKNKKERKENLYLLELPLLNCLKCQYCWMSFNPSASCPLDAIVVLINKLLSRPNSV